MAQGGVDRRAQIDADTVRALLLLNGGGAIALLALLPVLLEKDAAEPLVRAVLLGLIFMMGGLASVVVHNICRRKCSLHYEHHSMNPPKGRILGVPLWEPAICALGTTFKWLSLVAFLAAGSVVAITGLSTL